MSHMQTKDVSPVRNHVLAAPSNTATKEFYSYRILLLTEIRHENSITFGIKADVVPAAKIGSIEETVSTSQIEVKVVCLKALVSRWTAFRPELAQAKNLRKVLFHYGKEYLSRKLQTGNTSGLFQLALHSEIGPEAYPCDPATINIELKRWQTIEVSFLPEKNPDHLT